MDAIAIAVIAAIPNFAGFMVLAWSNNRTISKLFTALQSSSDSAAAAMSSRVVTLEARIQTLENLQRDLLRAFTDYPPDLPDAPALPATLETK